MKFAAGLLGLIGGLIHLSTVNPVLGLINLGSTFGAIDKKCAWVAMAPALLSLAGGAITFVNASVGGTLMLLGFLTMAFIYGESAGIAIVLVAIGALLSSFPSWRKKSRSGLPSEARDVASRVSSSAKSNPRYDEARWDALVKYDPDVAVAAANLKVFGTRWVDELAASYLAIGDKSYLAQIVAKLTADAERDAKLVQQGVTGCIRIRKNPRHMLWLMLHHFRTFLNGKLVGEIRNEGYVTFDAAPGINEIEVRSKGLGQLRKIPPVRVDLRPEQTIDLQIVVTDWVWGGVELRRMS